MAERSIGSGAFDPLSSSGVRTAGLRPGQGPASSRSQRRAETPRPASTAAGHTALAPALHLSPEEVRRRLDIARTYPSPRAPLRPISLYTMLVLAYCAGLRVGELARLNLGDVDLQPGAITIPGDEILQIPSPAFDRQCALGIA